MPITKEQLTNIARSIFNEIDANKNGALEKSELHEFSIKIHAEVTNGEKPFNEERFEKGWELLDKNGDGKVTFDEVIKPLLSMAEKAGVADE